jgi:predicted P-loop ATPase
VWVIEIAELDSLSRSDVGKIKAFMSRMSDPKSGSLIAA